ncbi:MAG: type II toxin-antitoxin system antitoxin SocA domain-containing protein [Halarcobacter ebronensis]|uniref:type II toxin-antitoxin system antitoxin SocA domain-containing protein n=1 Tax=Halarcobacter ebronensis TaxID=1462615 RepID=UPI003C7621DE
MKIDITKIANAILYMLEKDVKHLNDRKVAILLFLMDFENQKKTGEKIFNEEYIKDKRNPEPVVIGEIFEIIANSEDLDEEDERLYIIQELLDYLDIEVLTKDKFIELKFIKMEEEFDKSLFSRKELNSIEAVIEKYGEDTARKVANATFKIQKVRETALNEIII